MEPDSPGAKPVPRLGVELTGGTRAALLLEPGVLPKPKPLFCELLELVLPNENPELELKLPKPMPVFCTLLELVLPKVNPEVEFELVAATGAALLLERGVELLPKVLVLPKVNPEVELELGAAVLGTGVELLPKERALPNENPELEDELQNPKPVLERKLLLKVLLIKVLFDRPVGR